MSVNYCNQSCEFAFRGKRKTSAWIRRTAAAEGWETGAVSVVFCSDEALLEINRRYLKHDYYTDIITFDYSDPDKRTIGNWAFRSKTSCNGSLFTGYSTCAVTATSSPESSNG